MSGRTVGALVLAGILIVAPSPALAAEDEGPQQSVVKYAGYKQGSAWGRPCMILVVAPRQGGSPVELIVPNKNPEAYKFDPSPVVLDAVKNLKPGDLIDIRTSKSMGHNILNFITPHKSKPGEDDPNAFNFVESKEGKVAGKDSLGATVEKDGKSTTVWVPLVKGEDGKSAPDEEMTAAVKGFHKGQLLEVRVQTAGPNPLLKSISPYQAPEKAEFVKTGEQKVGEVNYMTVELKKDDIPVVLLVPARRSDTGAMVRDVELAGKVKGIRSGQVVEYKSRSSAGQVFLVDIRATGERASSRPAGDKPADKPKAVAVE